MKTDTAERITFDQMPETVGLILKELRMLRKKVDILEKRNGPSPEEDIVDYDEIAKRLDMTVRTARELYSRVPHSMAGRKCFFRWSDILEHIQSK